MTHWTSIFSWPVGKEKFPAALFSSAALLLSHLGCATGTHFVVFFAARAAAELAPPEKRPFRRIVFKVILDRSALDTFRSLASSGLHVAHHWELSNGNFDGRNPDVVNFNYYGNPVT